MSVLFCRLSNIQHSTNQATQLRHTQSLRLCTELNSYLRWVRNDGLFTDCEVDSDCDDVEGEGVGTDLKCGALFGMDALNGGVTEEVCSLCLGSDS